MGTPNVRAIGNAIGAVMYQLGIASMKSPSTRHATPLINRKVNGLMSPNMKNSAITIGILV